VQALMCCEVLLRYRCPCLSDSAVCEEPLTVLAKHCDVDSAISLDCATIALGGNRWILSS
jgi:hypothetical protein